VPTPAGDVYSLAATLYDLVAGKPPRPVPWPIDSFDHLGVILRSPVVPVVGVPPELHQVLVRALHPDVGERTPTAVRLRDELRALGPDSVPVVDHAPLPTSAHKRWPVIAAGVVAVLAIAGGGWWWGGGAGTTAAKESGSLPTNGKTDDLPPPRLKACATGYCVAEPTCFHGITTAGGQAAAARRAGSCADDHYWEAFAGGWLSGDVPKVDSDELAAAPEVASVCTEEAMKANTRPTVNTSTWQVTAVGFKDGDRSYVLCMGAREEGGETTTSAFGS